MPENNHSESVETSVTKKSLAKVKENVPDRLMRYGDFI